MKKSTTLYKGHRFPAEIIQYAVWLYHRFNLSNRDIEDLLAERGITVSYEAIRLWCNKRTDKLTSSEKCNLANLVQATAAFHSLNALILRFR